MLLSKEQEGRAKEVAVGKRVDSKILVTVSVERKYDTEVRIQKSKLLFSIETINLLQNVETL